MSKTNAILIILLIGLLLAGCATQSASGKKDGATMITEAAQTVVAMLTQTAAVQPTTEPTATASPTATATLAPSPTLPKTPTSAPAAVANVAVNSVTYSKCDMAGFVSDVSISDGTALNGGEEFTKTWELRNDGTCTWSSGYELIFYSGSQMDGPDSQQLIDAGDTVAPGGVVDISVDLVAPSTTGTYIGYWILRNASGTNFGIGSNASPFYVKIVVDSDATATPTPTQTSEYTATPTATTAATATATAVAAATEAPTTAPTLTTAPTSTPVPTETPLPATETPVPTETTSGS